MGKKAPKAVKKGKKKRKPKKSSERYKKYKIEGNRAKPARFCPRCGPGIFLAESKDRWFCGRCHYTEFKSKAENKEEKEKKE